MTELAERLGFGADDRILIINCDDLGSFHAANVGIYEALRDGIATSATLMVPCPWARDAAARYRGEDVGVHLTLNAEYDNYRWGPITHGPSLLDGDGGFPRTVSDVWDHADLDEVRRELRAQVERAILWGFDISHLDSHMGTLQLRPEFFDVYLDLAVEFRLPLRLSGASSERSIGFPFRRLAAEEGILFPDHFVQSQGHGSRATIEQVVGDLRPGVTEVFVHPAVEADELRAGTPDWSARVDDHALVTTDPSLAATLEAAGVHRVGYRELRDLQRSAGVMRPVVLVAAAMLLLAACDPKPSSPSPADIASIDVTPDVTLTVDEDGFDPATIKVEAGQIIEIENTGDEPHTATAESRFDTGLIEPGDTTTLVLTTPGDVELADAQNPHHTATITVTPATTK